MPDEEYSEAQRTCPTCGRVTTMDAYDIGDGPEFSCVHCEWCWGAAGQPLTMKPIDAMVERVRMIEEGLEGR